MSESSTGGAAPKAPILRAVVDAALLLIPIAGLGAALAFALAHPTLPRDWRRAADMIRRGFQEGDGIVVHGFPPQDAARTFAGLPVLAPLGGANLFAGPPWKRVWRVGRAPAPPQWPPVEGQREFPGLFVTLHRLPGARK